MIALWSTVKTWNRKPRSTLVRTKIFPVGSKRKFIFSCMGICYLRDGILLLRFDIKNDTFKMRCEVNVHANWKSCIDPSCTNEGCHWTDMLSMVFIKHLHRHDVHQRVPHKHYASKENQFFFETFIYSIIAIKRLRTGTWSFFDMDNQSNIRWPRFEGELHWQIARATYTYTHIHMTSKTSSLGMYVWTYAFCSIFLYPSMECVVDIRQNEPSSKSHEVLDWLLVSFLLQGWSFLWRREGMQFVWWIEENEGAMKTTCTTLQVEDGAKRGLIEWSHFPTASR